MEWSNGELSASYGVDAESYLLSMGTFKIEKQQEGKHQWHVVRVVK